MAEERHFGRAAARLHMAQPPLSQAVRRLEGDLGVELFRRTTRRVDLTEAGRAFVDRARSILTQVDAAADEARRVASGAVGHLTMGCVGSATYSLVPQLARALSRELPGVEVAFRGEMLVPDQLAALRSGAIDVGLLRPPVAEPGLRVTPLRRDRLVVALPLDHPLAARRRLRVADLDGVGLIVHAAARGAMMRGVVDRVLRGAGVEPLVRHEAGETSTLVTLVAGGLGVAVVPEPVTALGLDGVTHRPLVAPSTTVELAVAHREDRDEPHLARAVELVRRLTAGARSPGPPPPAPSPAGPGRP